MEFELELFSFSMIKACDTKQHSKENDMPILDNFYPFSFHSSIVIGNKK